MAEEGPTGNQPQGKKYKLEFMGKVLNV